MYLSIPMIFSKSNPPPGYYVYLYLREDGTPYYVGKGKGTRAWSTQHSVRPPKDLSRILIVSYALTEMWGFILERRLIQWFRRKDKNYTDLDGSRIVPLLRNMTDGGEGASGRVVKQQQRDKMTIAISGEKNPNYGKIGPMKGRTGKNNPLFGRERPEHSNRMAGPKNPDYDPTVFTFYNHSLGLVEHLTKYELRTKYNIGSTGQMAALVSGRRKSVAGWSLTPGGRVISRVSRLSDRKVMDLGNFTQWLKRNTQEPNTCSA